ncbi:MAG: hypothetical protein WCW01_05025 [Gammaproteobacteria bacterium]
MAEKHPEIFEIGRHSKAIYTRIREAEHAVQVAQKKYIATASPENESQLRTKIEKSEGLRKLLVDSVEKYSAQKPEDLEASIKTLGGKYDKAGNASAEDIIKWNAAKLVSENKKLAEKQKISADEASSALSMYTAAESVLAKEAGNSTAEQKQDIFEQSVHNVALAAFGREMDAHPSSKKPGETFWGHIEEPYTSGSISKTDSGLKVTQNRPLQEGLIQEKVDAAGNAFLWVGKEKLDQSECDSLIDMARTRFKDKDKLHIRGFDAETRGRLMDTCIAKGIPFTLGVNTPGAKLQEGPYNGGPEYSGADIRKELQGLQFDNKYYNHKTKQIDRPAFVHDLAEQAKTRPHYKEMLDVYLKALGPDGTEKLLSEYYQKRNPDFFNDVPQAQKQSWCPDNAKAAYDSYFHNPVALRAPGTAAATATSVTTPAASTAVSVSAATPTPRSSS